MLDKFFCFLYKEYALEITRREKDGDFSIFYLETLNRSEKESFIRLISFFRNLRVDDFRNETTKTEYIFCGFIGGDLVRIIVSYCYDTNKILMNIKVYKMYEKYNKLIATTCKNFGFCCSGVDLRLDNFSVYHFEVEEDKQFAEEDFLRIISFVTNNKDIDTLSNYERKNNEKNAVIEYSFVATIEGSEYVFIFTYDYKKKSINFDVKIERYDDELPWGV